MSGIYEIAIIGRLDLEFHSLNNEGTVGNVTEPRTLTLPSGEKTDGISGEMLKHIHAYYLRQMADENELCEACKRFEPSRADADRPSTNEPQEAIAECIKRCVLCDIHGFLLQRPACSRESTVEFGWAVGIPKIVKEMHTHIRRTTETEMPEIEEKLEKGNWGVNKCSYKGCTTKPEESPLYKVEGKWYCEKHLPERARQMIYHRPTRSGEYGIISVFQPWRIGLNDVTMSYEENVNRKDRYEKTLKAYEALFTRPEGAMTTTRLPHIKEFKGIIVYTESRFPVPIISPLKENYIDEIKEIAKKFE